MSLWKKKQLHILGQPETHQAPLHRILTTMDLILLGIGAIIGAGLFSITGIAAAENAGPAIVISFIIAAIGCGFAGLCYSELATMIPSSGSAYTYAYATMGQLIAWIVGWDLILEFAIGAATVSISWSAYAVALLSDWGIHLPTQIIASPWQPVKLHNGELVYGWINLPALLIVIALSYVLIRGVRQSAIVNAITVFIKVGVVLVFVGIGFFYIKPENYTPFIPENMGSFGHFGWSGILQAAGVVFFAYVGFDAVSTAAQETKDPARSIPRGILGSLFICTVLYIAFAFVMTGLVNYKELNVAAPVALAIDQTPFWWLSELIKIAILCGFTSVILVMMMGQSRIFYSMAKDRLLPAWFAEVHTRYATPWRSNLVLMFLVGGFGAFAPLSFVGHMTSIGTLLAFVIVCGGVLILRYTAPDHPRSFRTPWVPFIPVMGILVCFIMMVSLGIENWIRLFVWLTIGMLVYIFYSYRHANPPQIPPMEH